MYEVLNKNNMGSTVEEKHFDNRTIRGMQNPERFEDELYNENQRPTEKSIDMDFYEGQSELERLDRLNDIAFKLREINPITPSRDPRSADYSQHNKNVFDPGHEHLFPPKDKKVIHAMFESSDGWTTGQNGNPATFTFDLGALSIVTAATGAGENGYVKAYALYDTLYTAKQSAYQSVVQLVSDSSQIAYFGIGDLGKNIAGATGAEFGYGFKVDGSTLYAVTVKSDGATATETTTEVTNVDVTDFNEYRAVYDTRSCLFMVNRKVVAIHRDDLFDDDSRYTFVYVVQTSTTAARTLRAKYGYFAQKN